MTTFIEHATSLNLQLSTVNVLYGTPPHQRATLLDPYGTLVLATFTWDERIVRFEYAWNNSQRMIELSLDQFFAFDKLMLAELGYTIVTTNGSIKLYNELCEQVWVNGINRIKEIIKL